MNQSKNIKIQESGLVISSRYPVIGASPDGVVSVNGEMGLVEIKCPYKYRHLTPKQAAEHPDFCCELIEGEVKLKTNHNYYYQVMGQTAVKSSMWCDFVIWTTKGIHIERLHFNANLRQDVEKN